MLAQQNTSHQADAVDDAMAWHGNDARATIEALLQDRIRLQQELAMVAIVTRRQAIEDEHCRLGGNQFPV